MTAGFRQFVAQFSPKIARTIQAEQLGPEHETRVACTTIDPHRCDARGADRGQKSAFGRDLSAEPYSVSVADAVNALEQLAARLTEDATDDVFRAGSTRRTGRAQLGG